MASKVNQTLPFPGFPDFRANVTFVPLGRGDDKATPVIGSLELVQQ